MGKPKTIDVFTPANEAEANAIRILLEDHGIEADIISFHDTAFDGIFQAQKGWGRIRIHEKDVDEARKLIEEWQSAAPAALEEAKEQEANGEEASGEEEEAGRQKEGNAPEAQPARSGETLRAMWRIAAPFLLAVSAALNAYFLFWYEPWLKGGTVIKRDLKNRIIYVANYHKGKDTPYRVREYDPKGRTISEALDEDSDGKFELFIHYGKDETVVTRQIDKDGDGRYEISKTYHRSTLVTLERDRNNNGVYEQIIYYYDGKRRSMWMDRDEDGRLDQIYLLPGDRGRRASITDSDQDGFPEQARCTGSDGRKVSVDLLSCVVDRPR